MSSVTRLGENSSVRQNFSSRGQFFMAYLVFGKIFNLLWYTFCNWANLYCCTWPNIEQII